MVKNEKDIPVNRLLDLVATCQLLYYVEFFNNIGQIFESLTNVANGISGTPQDDIID